MIIKKDCIFQIVGSFYFSDPMRALKDINVVAFLEENDLSDFSEVTEMMLENLAEKLPVTEVEVEEIWKRDGDKEGWRIRLEE